MNPAEVDAAVSSVERWAPIASWLLGLYAPMLALVVVVIALAVWRGSRWDQAAEAKRQRERQDIP